MTVTMLACLLAGGTCIFTLSNTSEQPNTRSFPPFCVESTEQSRPLDWNKNEIPPSCCPYLKQHVWTGSGKSCTPCILLKAASLHHLHVLHLKILCSWGLAARGGSLQTSTLQNTAESACRMSTALTATTLPPPSPLLPRTQRSQTITKQNHQSMHIERKQPGFTIFTLYFPSFYGFRGKSGSGRPLDDAVVGCSCAAKDGRVRLPHLGRFNASNRRNIMSTSAF